MSIPKLALNSEEAATATGVSVDTIKRAIRSGRLRAKRSARRDNGDPAGRYLITLDALEEWLTGMEDA
jgi:excisionase family DNA binding protein